MDSVHLEGIKRGTAEQIVATFKLFGATEWYLTASTETSMSGVLVLASPLHAACFANFVENMAFEPPVKALFKASGQSNDYEKLTRLPHALLSKRIAAALAKWDPQISAQLDETLPEKDELLEQEILNFRLSSILEKQSRIESRKIRAGDLAASRDNHAHQESTGVKQLYQKLPDWNDEWSVFRRQVLDSGLVSVHNKTPRRGLDYYLAFDGKPRYNHDQRQAEKQLEAQVRTVSELVAEYFGEVDEDLVAMIESLIPSGREALASNLGDLLQQDTDDFIDKLLR